MSTTNAEKASKDSFVALLHENYIPTSTGSPNRCEYAEQKLSKLHDLIGQLKVQQQTISDQLTLLMKQFQNTSKSCSYDQSKSSNSSNSSNNNNTTPATKCASSSSSSSSCSTCAAMVVSVQNIS